MHVCARDVPLGHSVLFCCEFSTSLEDIMKERVNEEAEQGPTHNDKATTEGNVDRTELSATHE